jgi:TrmH family RNA methyltransferase
MNILAEFQNLSGRGDAVILPGLHALKHALRFGADILLSLSPNKAELLGLANSFAPDAAMFIESSVVEVELGQYQSLIKDAHRTGVVSIAKKPELKLKRVLESEKPIVLIEDCRNLKNLGAVIRVSAGADIGAVLSLSKQIDVWHPDVLIGSAGLNFALPCLNITEDDLSLIKQTRTLIAMDPEGEPYSYHPETPNRHPELDSGSNQKNDSEGIQNKSSLSNWRGAGGEANSPLASGEGQVSETSRGEAPKPPIYIFGTERDGISPLLLNLSDQKLSIPMKPGVSSLNLATSVAIVVYNYCFDS